MSPQIWAAVIGAGVVVVTQLCAAVWVVSRVATEVKLNRAISDERHQFVKEQLADHEERIDALETGG